MLPTSLSLGVDSSEDEESFFEAVLEFGWRGRTGFAEAPETE